MKFRQSLEYYRKLDKQSLVFLRDILFIIVLGDIFGIYWYLGWKTIGSSILVVCMVLLALILIGIRRYDNEKMTHTENENEEGVLDLTKKEKSKEPEDDSMFGDLGLSDSGMPSAEEYNKRVEKSLGIMDIGI